uniref:TIMP metallopeptidase inhibitor 4 n=1 Tax=Sinocyclocheilus grahami TaxID=75366 RepID=A0A672NWT5_SINGR
GLSQINNCFALLFFWSVALNEQVTEGCRCLPKHPQQQFCASDIGTKFRQLDTSFSNTIFFNKKYQLDKKIFQVIYTSQTSCGINLENGEYLLSGPVKDGRVVVNLCDRVEPWNQLSRVQKMYLSRYQSGCVCEISTCIEKLCQPSTKNECILTDWSSLWPFEDGKSVHESACIRHSDGSCGWYEGTGKPSENDTMDVSEV